MGKAVLSLRLITPAAVAYSAPDSLSFVITVYICYVQGE